MTQKRFLTEVVLLTKSYNLQDFKDWLFWHLDVVGFECAHIFDNESSVDIKSVCDSYGDRVTYEKVSGWANQYNLYNTYVNHSSRAWWVLPIDDDEFLYVSSKYGHNVNILMLWVSNNKVTTDKLCIGWRNLFPIVFTESRLDPCLIKNSIGWSNEASEIWQAGNRPVKTFVKLVNTYEWSDRLGHYTHDPLVNGKILEGTTLDGGVVKSGWQLNPTKDCSDVMLYHYQFKCNKEWLFKCKNRLSPGSHSFYKNYPLKYKELYSYTLLEDTRMLNLWGRYVVD